MHQRERQRVPILSAAFVAGAQALVAQTLLLREELVLYGGNEVAVGAFLGLWLFGIAAGAVAVRRLAEQAGRLATWALLAQPVLLLLAIWAARTAKALSGVPAYEPFPLASLLVWTLPIAVPVALATGASVPALAARARETGGSVTEIYVFEALGAFLGGAGATLLLAVGCEPGALLFACCALGAWGGALVERSKIRRVLAGVGLVMLVLALPIGPLLGRALRTQQLQTILPGAQLLDDDETATGSLILASLERQQILLLDGRVLAAFPDPERVERAAGTLAAVTGGPRTLLVIGQEAVDTLPGLLALGGLERIVWLVPDPRFRSFAMRHVPGLAGDPRLEVTVGDPLRSWAELAAKGSFDAIWLLVDTPLRRADDRFLTLANLEALAGMLAPEGVLAVPVRSAENYVGPRLRLAVGTVVAGVGAVFDAVRLLPGEDALVLGAHRAERLSLEPQDLEQVYRSMGPDPPRLDREGFASLLNPDRVRRADELATALLNDPLVRPSRLDRPLALFHNLLVRAEQEDPDLASFSEALRDQGSPLWVPFGVLALFALGGVAAQRRGQEASRSAAVAVLAAGGAIGMAFSLTLLHIYQGRFGTLYLEVGWLFGLWMVGLALGGMGARLACRRCGPQLPGLGALLALAAGAAAVALWGGAVIPGRAGGAAAFVLAGALTGALIPVAETLLARAGVVGARAGVAIEAADHVGGAVCALVFGVLAIPILGIRGAAWVIAGLALFGAASVVLPGFCRLPRRRLHAIRHAFTPTSGFRSFPYRRTGFVLLALCVAAVAGNAAIRTLVAGPRVHLGAEALAASGLPPPWREQREPAVHYRAGPEGNDGIALASRAVARVNGYAGPINLLIGTDGKGAIRRVSLLEHRETPSYLEGASAFFQSLAGKSLLQEIRVRPKGAQESAGGQDAARRGQMVDAMTGATVTSRAVARALEAAGRRLAEPVFGAPYVESEAPRPGVEPRTVYLAAAFGLLIPTLWFGGRWTRRAWLLGQIIVGGVLLGVQFSTVQVLSLLRFELDGNVLAWTGLLATGVFLLAGLLGPVYCGYLCPAGALQEWLGTVGAALGLTRALPKRADRRARFLKYVLLAVVILGALGAGSTRVEQLDLLRAVWDPDRGGAGAVLLALAGAGCLLVIRFGCRYLCPTGAFLNLANKFTPLRRFLPAKSYPACDLGVRAPADVDCIQCNRCRLGETLPRATQARAAQALLVATLVVLILTVLPVSAPQEAAAPIQAHIEPVDVNLLKIKISAGSLSDEPALYWRVVRP